MFALTTNQTALLVAIISLVGVVLTAAAMMLVGWWTSHIRNEQKLANVALTQINDAVNHVDTDDDERMLRQIVKDIDGKLDNLEAANADRHARNEDRLARIEGRLANVERPRR